MKILVTGANGFLGRHVVAAFLERGQQVRALIRPAANVDSLHWPAEVEIVRADLRAPGDLASAFDGIDALVHLAAAVTGSDEHQFVSTVVGTERLLAAMAKSNTKRLVLASSFSVYDWSQIRGTLSENSALEADGIPSSTNPPAQNNAEQNRKEVEEFYQRDGYAVAKLWQEKIVRRAAEQNQWQLTVLRPGFIWGRGNEYLASLGQKLGSLHLTIAPLARPPLTHVANCADAFATATLDPRAIGQTYNVIDADCPTTSHYLTQYRKGKKQKLHSIPIPYFLGKLLTHCALRTSKIIFKGKGKLPSLLVPIRYEARFKPLCFASAFPQALNWKQPLTYTQALAKTYNDPSPPQ